MSIENNTQGIKINDFSFDESKFKIRSRSILGAPEIPMMVAMLVKKGIVKNEMQAITVLLSAVVLFVGVSIFLINKSVHVPTAIISSELLSGN